MSSVPAILIALATAAAPTSRGEVIDFSATWCGPCQQVAPLVARLEREGLPIRKVDVDQERPFANQFRIKAMPTFVLVVDGREVDRRERAMSEAELRAWVKRIPTLQDSVAEGKVLPTSGTISPFVADPNTRLGQPQSINRAFPSETAAHTPAVNPLQDNRAFPATASPVSTVADASMTNSQPNTAAVQKDPMAASVRLRVTIDGQINLGSGTLIESAAGKAHIVTCGHIFRGINESSRIEVNLFQDGREQSVMGQLVKYDLDADVGLIVIPTSGALPTVPVARSHQAPQAQEPVLSIGCSGGQNPTTQEIQITAVNPYLGPENLECTGVPVQGRSGGGLFRPTGELVGICIAADPERKRGVYAGLAAVHSLLKDAGLSHLVELAPSQFVQSQPFASDAARTPVASVSQETPVQFPSSNPAPATGGSLLAAVHSEEAPRRHLFDDPSSLASAGNPPVPQGTPIQLGAGSEDAEVICIIRPRNQPESASRVVIVHQASPKLLSYLRGEMGTSTDAAGTGSMLSYRAERLPRPSLRPMLTHSTVPAATDIPSQRRASQSAALVSAHHYSQPRHTLQQTSLSARRYVRTPSATLAR